MTEVIQYPEAVSAELQQLFEQTKRLAIAIKCGDVIDEKGCLYQSKIGGSAYFPKDADYPVNAEGLPLGLVAQINLDDLFADSSLADACQNDPYLKSLPKQGMLSFFVDVTDDLMGLDFTDPPCQSGYRVIYFPEINCDETALSQEAYTSLKAKVDSETVEDYGVTRLHESYALTFSLKEAIAPLDIESLGDADVEKLQAYIEENIEDANNEELLDVLYDLWVKSNSGHGIGGYPYFTQADPRQSDSHDNILLLQIDSVDEILIGDCGSLQFFISQDNLIKHDFSKVVYDWACG